MALLVVIYLAFISLGLPDGVLGSIWPVMQQSLDLPFWSAGLIGATSSIGTVVSALLSYRMTSRFGTRKVTLVSVTMTAAALLGFSFASSLPMLMLWAIPLGLGAGSVDSALNNYVSLHYEARHMNWLHSFWGLGASAGPAVMGLALSLQIGYRSGYRILTLMQTILVFALIASLSLWVDPKGKREGEQHTAHQKGSLRHKALPFALLSFFFYCALEISTGLWAVSYLVQVKQLLPSDAAFYGSLFFLGITVGRMASGFISYRLSNIQMVFLGLFLCLISIISLFFASLIFAGLSLLLLGLGCAPIFPSLIHQTPRSFGTDLSQRIIGLQMASAYIGSTVTPPLFGLVGSYVGLQWMPLLQGIILVLLVSSITILVLLTRNKEYAV
ncbi:MFS transporter [uncultured Sphaerochaeta sp.]|uniref:MFS transporter n=1 Tax=uncultured Sphaerochaeta sp. TaxID=886478 RepID=UPI0029CAA307|nr:MFS transporter [uncultured Sphaerochaeta sp.]